MNLGFLTCCLTTFTFIVVYASKVTEIENDSLIKAIDTFGIELYKRASKDNNENIIICPLSTHLILSALIVNATGRVLLELENTLELRFDDNVFKKYRNLLINLRGATALTVVHKVSMIEDFTPIDLSNKVIAVSLLTFWHDNKLSTNGYRNNNNNDVIFIRPTSLVIDNNISFNGKWQERFSKYSTTTRAFVTEAQIYYIQMMSIESYFLYGRIPGARASFVKLPFQDSGIFMLVVLPDAIDGLEEVEKSLETVTLKQIIENGQMKHVDLELPKFKVKFTVDLKQILRQMGLISLFREDFFRLQELNVDGSDMVQTTSIEISEGGTEDGTDSYSFVPVSLSNGVIFKADHPFHYKIIKQINDNEYIVLFVGNIKKL